MKRFAKGIIPISIILALWIIGSQHVNPLFLPRVSSVYRSFKLLLANGMLMKGIGISFYRITLATLLSGAVSLPIGLLVYHFKVLDDMILTLSYLIDHLGDHLIKKAFKWKYARRVED